jgi:ribosomal protein L11 methyltransferase
MPETGPQWLEVSLVVDGEYAEVVAEVLSRYTPGGVSIEATAIRPDVAGEGTPYGPLRVRGFLTVDQNLEETRRKVEEALWYLSRIQPEKPLPPAQFTLIQEVNWVEAWKEHYHPIEIGQKLMIVPAWLQPDMGGRVPIIIDPGMAFGTGTHPTTQLCLEMVEAHLRPTIMDIGCGSGILAIAALKLGAEAALGVDIDEEAIDNARQNAQKNGIQAGLELEPGSLAEVLQSRFSLRRADLVLANILAAVLARLLDEGMADLLNPGGILVMSGILAEQWSGPSGIENSPSLEQTVVRHGLEVVDFRQSGDWIAVAVSRANERR